MKNILIIILLLIIGYQCIKYNSLRNDYTGIIQAIEEEII